MASYECVRMVNEDLIEPKRDYWRDAAAALRRNRTAPERADRAKLEPLIAHAARAKVAIALDELPPASEPAGHETGTR